MQQEKISAAHTYPVPAEVTALNASLIIPIKVNSPPAFSRPRQNEATIDRLKNYWKIVVQPNAQRRLIIVEIAQ